MTSSSVSTVQISSLISHRPRARGFEQAVADEGLDLLGEDDALHADRDQFFLGRMDGRRRGLLAADDFNERQQVDGIIRDERRTGVRDASCRAADRLADA
jgi:hypothetical protein